MHPPVHSAADLTAIPNLAHGFFGRQGGVSTGDFESLNASFASADAREHVAENRARIASALDLPKLAGVRQVHSAHVVTLTDPDAVDARPEADALVTALPGIGLGVLTADCAPLLFADPVARVIGAAHAGWQGAVDGIAHATITAMEALGARRDRMVAVIGPTISGRNYEVGPERAAEIRQRHEGAAPFIIAPPAGREHFDLPGFLGSRLRAAGVGHVVDLGLCTYAAPDRFFSHRYATHAGTGAGRQLAVIGLR